MANYYTVQTAEQSIPCTQEEFEQASRLLDPDCHPSEIDEEASGWDPEEGEDDEPHGFDIEYHKNQGLYLFAELNGNSASLPAAFCRHVGQLLTKVNLPYLEVGYAVTCDKARPGSHSGGSWRLYPDGSIVFPRILWPEDVDSPHKEKE